MEIYLIRHAERDSTSSLPDEYQSLTSVGLEQTENLSNNFKEKNVVPTLFLTSRNTHAYQTAEILRSNLNRAAPLFPLDALTPYPPELSTPGIQAERYFTEIVSDLKKIGKDLNDGDIIIVILHNPRTFQLGMVLKGITPWPHNKRITPWPHNVETAHYAGTIDDFTKAEGDALRPRRFL
jgi:phosphohistidine phosphatase SixA